MELINLTPHAINIYAIADCTEQPGGRGYTANEGATPILTLQPSGTVSRASQQQEFLPAVECDGVTISVCRMVYGEPVELPDAKESVGLIVSALTANAAYAYGRCTSDLFIIQGVVRDATGAIIGCTGLAKL